MGGVIFIPLSYGPFLRIENMLYSKRLVDFLWTYFPKDLNTLNSILRDKINGKLLRLMENLLTFSRFLSSLSSEA